jgi:geranylgeranylglycerol-phosphate geranylgeranyltransferase
MGFKAKAKALSDLVRTELPITAGICVLAGEIIALERFPSAFIGLMVSIAGFFKNLRRSHDIQ